MKSERGRPVGHAFFSDESEITLRMIAFGPAAPPPDFIGRRLAAAMAYRESLALDATATERAIVDEMIIKPRRN